MVIGDLAWYQMVVATVDAIYQEELNRPSDTGGNANWLYHAREGGKDAAWIRDQVRQSPEWHALHDPPPTPPLRALPPFPPGSYDRDLWVDPPTTRDYLRADSWGVEVPGLPWVSRGSSEHPERLLTYFLYKYSKEDQARALDTYASRGYTHFVTSWPDVRSDGGFSLNWFVDHCGQIKQKVKYVHVKLASKDYDPRDQSSQQWADRLHPVIDALKGVADEFGVWEWDSFNVPGMPTVKTLKRLGVQAHTGGASFWLHFYPEHTSWFADGDPRGRYGFYDDLGTDVDGLDYQTRPEWSIQETQARLVDTLKQFAAQGNRHKLRFFEDQATLQFTHDHPNEDDANLRGYLALCTRGPVHVWGFGNGARRPDGSPI